jgi:hypothetical protein
LGEPLFRFGRTVAYAKCCKSLYTSHPSREYRDDRGASETRSCCLSADRPSFRTCFASRYEAETQWAKPQNGAQMTSCSGATRGMQKPFCARSTKSQRWERSDRVLTGVAVDVSPNRFSTFWGQHGTEERRGNTERCTVNVRRRYCNPVPGFDFCVYFGIETTKSFILLMLYEGPSKPP